MGIKDVLVLIAMMLAGLAMWMLVPGWMIRRQIPVVIKMFRKANAVGIRDAKFAQEIGVAEKGFLQRMMSRRDYKPKALEFLIQTNVVLMTEEGKLYITEESIAQATWLKLKKQSAA